ncbi:methyl-accepting chemotaxis protein [Rhizobiaceae bacterium n13]|uniref:Methyl-accepting chemotaxis protein n=1 Tax=Ferirhizobium litorale TaxID=2927786 RepID=A0AAE3QCN8_9HYPH|nr:methyl-accepting chemotaxis protein [Fererhizobium litorale]MDI7862270.1 methyl-accepting chemotaxis protein [Fererhizobium litorale]MDI7922456.1 methyl-accepting chemotaxis protein [Fererhizobium litorale]
MLKHAKIKTKILAVIALLAAISITSLSYILLEFKQADTTFNAFIDNEAQAAILGTRASAAVILSPLQASMIVNMVPGSPQFQAAQKVHDDYYARAEALLKDSTRLVPSVQAATDEILTTVGELKALTSKVIEQRKAGRSADAINTLGKVNAKMDEVTKQLVANNDVLMQMINDGGDAAHEEITDTITLSIVAVTVAMIVAVGAGFFVAQAGITNPMMRLRARMEVLAQGNTGDEIDGLDRGDEIGQMAAAVSVFRANAIERARLEEQAEADRNLSESERAARERQKAAEAADLQFAVQALGDGLGRLSNGDLAYRIETPFVTQLDSLRQDFNNSVNKLNEAMQAVGSNARAISAGANEIRSSADDMSKRTEQQAASVEETAAALEQITTTVKDAARRAEEASQLVGRTRTGAEKSGQVVRTAVDAMHQIEKSSSEISNIIGVIDDIAFQTNLLALNAGVEAARAGEAGKGFAVVAQEVRELAQRSANAAKEIKSLITTSGEQVQTGVQLVVETGKALDVIVAEVQEINRHVHAIAEAAREQSVGLQEINTAVNTMDQGTQQNAAMVEESTAASHGLATEAGSLIALMGQFKLTGTQGGAASTAKFSPALESGRARISTPRQPAIKSAGDTTRPVPSPARSLGQRLAGAFGGGSTAAKQEADWTEF